MDKRIKILCSMNKICHRPKIITGCCSSSLRITIGARSIITPAIATHHHLLYHSNSNRNLLSTESSSSTTTIVYEGTKIPELSVVEVAKAMRLIKSDDDDDENSPQQQQKEIIYIDCRSEEEQATGIVPGSINFPYPHNGDIEDLINSEEWLEDIQHELFDGNDDHDQKDIPIFVGCKKGPRSTMACEVLIRAGYTNVTNVQGGMLAWSRANLPMVPYTG